MQDNNNPSRKNFSTNTIIAVILLIFYLAYAASNMIAQRSLLIDDSFITYRYAKNLAKGYGIVWNPGEAPVEGYTNFLLVILLAPFIKLGADPLLTTRLLSLTAIGAACLLLYLTFRKHYQVQRETAIISISAFLLLTNTDYIALIGLETLLYTAALFFAFILAVLYINTQRARDGYLFSLASFTAFLLRPEILLLVLAFIIMAGVSHAGKQKKIAAFFQFIKPVVIGFFIPLFLYLFGKYLYFGTIIPNPYYIKAATQLFYSERGITSIFDFVSKYHLLCATALFALLFNRDTRFQTEKQLAGLFCLFYLLFYMRIDTLMDVGGRFLYPIAIFLFYMSIPVLNQGIDKLLQQSLPALRKIPLIVLGTILLVNPASIGQSLFNYQTIFSPEGAQPPTSNTIPQREYQAGLQLHKYKDIQKVRIAFGDAGLIPYFSEAFILDDVGLNDRFIATHTDLRQLTDYYFAQKPDLAILTANKNLTWTTNGHGPLGNFSRWANDARWDAYVYTGTIQTGQGYDLQLFVRKDMHDFDNFYQFLREKVADGYYDVFPIQIGSYIPEKNVKYRWVAANIKNRSHPESKK